MSTQKDYSEASVIAERFVQEYKNEHGKIDNKLVGGIIIGFTIPSEDNRYLFYPSNVSAITLGELKIERDAGVPVGKNIFYVARFNKEGEKVKPEEIDLSRVNVEEIIEEEMKSLRNLKQKRS